VVAEPANSTVDAIASGASLRFLEPDPLAEVLFEHADPPTLLASIDPMLDELAALLVTRPVAAQATGDLS
jgi:hypothetical protein